MLTATNHTLEKLETLLKAAGFKVRYEKGNFKTGACLLQSNSVIMVNRFSDLESKIMSLAELIRQTGLEEHLLDEKQLTFYRQIRQTELHI